MKSGEVMLCCSLICSCASFLSGIGIDLVPAVRELTAGAGVYEVRPKICWPKDKWHDFDRVAQAMSEAAVCREADASLPSEGYRLEVTPEGVRVGFADAAGAFYAMQTLRQLAVDVEANRVTFACCTVKDWPSLRWRGVLLDEARHFLGKAVVKKTLEAMARHKFNVLHWHLTDDQGWRLDVPGFPELVQYGAVRPKSVAFGTHGRWLPPEGKIDFDYDEQTYGPFYYTVSEVREILAFARERHIVVVPEIELPGHVRAFLAAHPECSCMGSSLERTPRCGWSIEEDVLCVGNDRSLELFKVILDRVCELFPDTPYVHIGGDECPRVRWKTCAKCQKRLKEIGGKDESELQGWITTQIVRHLESRGKRAVGWDEVLSGDVPSSTVGMTWRSQSADGAGTKFVSAAEAAGRGHDMVLAPNDTCYLDKPQGLADDPFPYYAPMAKPITLQGSYSFDPFCLVGPEDRSRILGAQANMWGECIHNVCDLEWKMWPRACALSEVFWMGDAKPGYADFERRMRTHRRRMLSWNVICAPLD